MVFGLIGTLLMPLAAATAQDADHIPPVLVEHSDPEMTAAIAEAKRTLPQFLVILSSPPRGATEFSIKYPLGGWEHIWVSDLVRSGNSISGKLANVPEQPEYHLGDLVSVPLASISDYAWRDKDGVMHGHLTTRVLLPHLTSDEAAEVRKFMGW